MASLHRDITIDAPADLVWDAVRDVGRPHARLTPTVLTDARFDGDEHRIVTFADGFVARERIVDIDDDRRRVAYSVVSEPFSHHHASMEVVPDGADRCRLVWIADLLPSGMAPVVSELMDLGAADMQATLRG